MKDILLNLNPKALSLIREIGGLAEDKGMKAYLVGGPVRDLMLRIGQIDLDIAVEGNGMGLAEGFSKAHPGARLTKYPAFKTAAVLLPDGTQVDFATARRETYVRPGAYPAVRPSDIKEDLKRRDFTINAMAIAINPQAQGRLIDPWGGREDLSQKRLRVLHDQSFIDDATRILRLARFKARFGFTVERHTLKLLKAGIKIKVLDTIKPQRYRKDFNKILKEPNSKLAVKFLKSWDAYKE